MILFKSKQVNNIYINNSSPNMLQHNQPLALKHTNIWTFTKNACNFCAEQDHPQFVKYIQQKSNMNMLFQYTLINSVVSTTNFSFDAPLFSTWRDLYLKFIIIYDSIINKLAGQKEENKLVVWTIKFNYILYGCPMLII